MYAGIEALKLPSGGVSYIARLFGCSRDTVLRGIKELKKEETLEQNRERKTGGGRKTVFEKHIDIDEVFLVLLKEHTAGDPMDEKVKWTNLTSAEMVSLLSGKGFKVSRNIVKKLLKTTYIRILRRCSIIRCLPTKIFLLQGFHLRMKQKHL